MTVCHSKKKELMVIKMGPSPPESMMLCKEVRKKEGVFGHDIWSISLGKHSFKVRHLPSLLSPCPLSKHLHWAGLKYDLPIC